MSMTIDEFRTHLIDLKRSYTYEQLVEDYSVNQYFLWKIINDKDYKPPVSIRRKLKIVLEERPPRIAVRKDDAASAARTLLNNFERDVLKEVMMIVGKEIE